MQTKAPLQDRGAFAHGKTGRENSYLLGVFVGLGVGDGVLVATPVLVGGLFPFLVAVGVAVEVLVGV